MIGANAGETPALQHRTRRHLYAMLSGLLRFCPNFMLPGWNLRRV
jgi:hypothetical protein